MNGKSKTPYSPAVNYALGVAVAALAVLLQRIIQPWVGDQVPFLFFLPALMFAAVTLGRGPASIVMLAGAVNAVLLGSRPQGFAMHDAYDAAAVVVYLVLGTLFVFYGGHLRITTARVALAEKRLALAQEDTGMGVFELDFEAGTAYVSPSLCQILGQPVEFGPIPLERWFSQLGAGHVEGSRLAMQQRLEEGVFAYEREQRVDLPNGGERWLLNRVRLDAGPDGQVSQARGATLDITERKRVDAALQATRAELQQQLRDLERLHGFSQKLVSAGDDFKDALQGLLELLVDLYGAHHGVVSLCDPGDKALNVIAQYGFGADTIEKLPAILSLRRRTAGLITEGARPVDDVDYEALLIVHRALAFQEGLHGLHSMPLLSRSDGFMGAISIMFAERHELTDRESRLGEVGATTAAAVVERERARVLAAASERRFFVALESSIVPFSILSPVRDDAGRIVDFQWTYLNPAAALALGREAKDLLGCRIGEVLPTAWKNAPAMFDRYVSVVERGEQCEFEVRSVATGRGGWFNVIASPLQGSAAVWFQNITDRKVNEEALHDAGRRKDEFLATLAHELRNPLAPIRQSVRIVRSSAASEDQRRWSLGVVERQVQHMSLLLDDLLDVSRVGRGTLLLRKSWELLTTVVETAIETARPHIEAKRHRLEVHLPEPRVSIDVDPLRIAQVLGNLLTNAAKYTNPGGVIRLTAAVEAGDLVIRVADNGIGLSKDQLERVFELFSQIPAALEQSQGGLGIGLALSRGLIELHGGSISAASAGPGRGTEMTVRLPDSCVKIVSERDPAPIPQPLPVARTRAARRILIADDNADAADSLAEWLRLQGHEVFAVYDGEQALATFLREQPDAALLDVGMPRLSGIEVVKAIRQGSSGRHATLIAVTGWAQERDRRVALESGFDFHFTKPIQPEDIQALIEQGPRGKTFPRSEAS